MRISDYIDADLLDRFGIKKNCVSDWEEGYMDEHATGNI